jgi:hypothetical protein
MRLKDIFFFNFFFFKWLYESGHLRCLTFRWVKNFRLFVLPSSPGSSSPCRYFELSYAATCKILVCPKKIYQSVQFRTLGSALLPFSNGNRQGKPLTIRNQSCLSVRFHAGICLQVLRHSFTEIHSLTLHVTKDCGDKILYRIAVLSVWNISVWNP